VVFVEANRGLLAITEAYFNRAAANCRVSQARGSLDYSTIFYVSIWPLDGCEAVDAIARGEN